MPKLHGVATLLRGPEGESSVLVPYVVEPDEPKRFEWSGPYKWMLVPPMLEMISGKIEAGETAYEAMRREALEERQLHLNGNTHQLNRSIEVGQDRSGVSVDFLVHLFVTQLSRDQLADLSMNHPLTIVGDEAIETFLERQRPEDFRPSVYNLLLTAAAEGFWRFK